MPKPRRKPLSDVQLAYLAGLAQANPYFHSATDTSPAAISRKTGWPNFLAKTYGGRSAPFISSAGKEFQGWFLTVEERLDLWIRLQPHLQGVEEPEYNKILAKLEKAVGKKN